MLLRTKPLEVLILRTTLYHIVYIIIYLELINPASELSLSMRLGRDVSGLTDVIQGLPERGEFAPQSPDTAAPRGRRTQG